MDGCACEGVDGATFFISSFIDNYSEVTSLCSLLIVPYRRRPSILSILIYVHLLVLDRYFIYQRCIVMVAIGVLELVEVHTWTRDSVAVFCILGRCDQGWDTELSRVGGTRVRAQCFNRSHI